MRRMSFIMKFLVDEQERFTTKALRALRFFNYKREEQKIVY
jgi:hypothetical protein